MATCPVCDEAAMTAFIDRSRVPVHQNLLCSDPESARAVSRGELRLAVCPHCGFVSNQAFDERKLSYGQDYDNNQICSGAFSSYVDELVDYLVTEHGVRECRIVEVGCGKGYFLRRMIDHPTGGNTGIGFDPSYVGPSSDLGGRLRFEQRFYDETAREVRPDVVICRHVIEHVADPSALVRGVRSAMNGSVTARVFFETPCVDWILANQVVWDLFYEHCSLFSAGSLTVLFERAGFHVSGVRHVFGGQYLWLEATLGDARLTTNPSASITVDLANAYSRGEPALIERWRSRLDELGSRVAIWGAGAKGATFVNLADPDCRRVRCVVDVNPGKHGKFIPGTGHPIVSPATLDELGVTDAILMNPNYRDEISALLAAEDSRVRLIDQEAMCHE